MRIAAKQTVAKWNNLRSKLQSNPTSRLWGVAYDRFYRQRIETRYLAPMKVIETQDERLGEGFAVVALFCTLVEYLESCEKGDNFRFLQKGEKLGANEYSSKDASMYFKAFLTNRVPFCTRFPSSLVDSFYRDVRCGLLHEARTRGGWILKTTHSAGKLVYQRGKRITLYRNELRPALELYFVDYKGRLLTDPNTQAAFIRKFDHLCIP